MNITKSYTKRRNQNNPFHFNHEPFTVQKKIFMLLIDIFSRINIFNIILIIDDWSNRT